MKSKSFQKYLEKKLTKQEIADIETQAKLEVKTITKSMILLSLTAYPNRIKKKKSDE